MRTVSTITSFQKVTEYYQKKDYSKALELLQELSGNSPHDYALHYNLGHVYFRMNDKVKAMGHFHRSALENPRFADARYNYEYILKKLQLPEQFTPSLSQSFAQKIPFSTSELLGAACLFSILLWIFVAFLFLQKKLKSYGSTLILAIPFLFLFGTPLFFRYFYLPEYGFVLADKTEVYSNPGRDNVVLFTVPLGGQVRREETYFDGRWEKVSLPNGKKGWMEKDKIHF